MISQLSRLWTLVLTATLAIAVLVLLRPSGTWLLPAGLSQGVAPSSGKNTNEFDWSRRQQYHPVSHFQPVPRPTRDSLPKVQYDFASQAEAREDKATRRARMAQIKNTMKRCWASYRLKAWMKDELAPISGTSKNTFGGWAATLVDSLDTLWIMDMKAEFFVAVDAVVDIDFSMTTIATVNVFETNIRYLGGFISAYDLSGDRRLLDKAVEVAHMLYAAFDTPNRMPVLRWELHQAVEGEEQLPARNTILAEIGSLSLEFTRLSQITSDPRWYDAIQRIMQLFDEQQSSTALPGLWPIQVNVEEADFSSGTLFSLAAWADSMYEYLPKMYALLGGSEQYAKMYTAAADTAMRYALYKPMTKDGDDLLMLGAVRVNEALTTVQPELQHLSCFAGGMFALGGRLLENDTHVDAGLRLTNGCTWAYKQFPTGIMPESSNVIPCGVDDACKWDEGAWHKAVTKDATQKDKDNLTSAEEIIKRDRLPPGFSAVSNRKYLLRPEAIESVFVLYRVTGNTTFQETAWTMFRSIYTHTVTEFAHGEILDVTDGSAPRGDSMESFWTAETLKYFYLTFADPEYISLDEYVFNTEAHPFKRPGTGSTSSKFNWQWKWR